MSITPAQNLYHCPYAANISLSKIKTTLSDPINGTNNPKSIPGSVIEYTLTAVNYGSAPADNNVIRDSLNTMISTQQLATWASGFIMLQTNFVATSLVGP